MTWSELRMPESDHWADQTLHWLCAPNARNPWPVVEVGEGASGVLLRLAAKTYTYPLCGNWKEVGR